MITKLPFIPDWSHYVTIPDMSAITPKPRMAITKATEGNYEQDASFLNYWAAFKANGIPRGAYHFYVTNISGQAQANYFINFISRGGVHDDDLLIVDLEVAGINASDLIIFLNTVEATFRNNVIILYSRKNILEAIPRTLAQTTRLKQYALWLAWYPFFPDMHAWIDPTEIPVGWGSPVGWQYSDNGQITGAIGKTDMNFFTPDFLALFPHPFPSDPPADIITTPHDGMTRISGMTHGWHFELFKIDISKTKKVEIICSDILTTISNYAEAYKPTLAINGGEWNDREPNEPNYLQPKDYTVHNGNVCVQRTPAAPPSLMILSGNDIAIDHIQYDNVEQALSGVIYLVRNGVIESNLYDTSKPDNTEGHARTVYGYGYKDYKKYLMCFVSEGKYPNQGLIHLQTAEKLIQYGAVTAFFASGGGDTSANLDGKQIIVPENIVNGVNVERALPSVLLVYAKDETMTATAVSTTHDLSLRPLHQVIDSSTIVSILKNTVVPVLDTWKAPETTTLNNKDDF